MRAERDDEDFEYRANSKKEKVGPTVLQIALGVWIGGTLAIITWTTLSWLMLGGIISAASQLYLK